jgi:hypothetical protein
MKWEDQFLDEICKVDREQSPHGLYGMPDVLRKSPRPAHLAELLGGSRLSICIARRLGWTHFGAKQDSLHFQLPEGESVRLNFISYASTKVRRYGDTYVLDKVHGKHPGNGPDLSSLLPRLQNHKPYRSDQFTALLFVAYVTAAREFDTLLGEDGTSQSFLDRYRIQFNSRTWEDVHHRHFHTGLFLWTQQSEAPDGTSS